MITLATSSAARLAARASVPFCALGLTLLAAPAHADAAKGWTTYEDINTLQALLLLGGVPILLFVLITLAVYLPALARGEDVSPAGGEVEDHWLGGPRNTKELTTGNAGSSETGGARGTW